MESYSYWKTIYFDGFAGTGSKGEVGNSILYQQLKITEAEEKTYQGAAERVLGMEDLSFDFYYFVDKKEQSLLKLENKLNNRLDLTGKKIFYKPGDANRWISELATALKTKKYAALVFLDPFGMQIDWNSIEELKDTRSDVWILIPTGVIVNRLLDKAGQLKNIKKLESFFGISADEIKSTFYLTETRPSLFGGEEERISKVAKPIEKIASLYATRLNTIWKHVTEKPLRLDNRQGVPIFHFVFASNNKNALKIANQIIQNI